MNTTYTVITPDCLLSAVNNTAAYIVTTKADAEHLARAFSKASKQAVEVRRQPIPYSFKMLYLA